jgi:protein-S-isoprenylcysteine O-methyltransferase Ste14
VTRRYWFPKPYADVVMKLRVSSGFLLVASFAWLASPTLHSLAWGVPVSIAGLAIRAWAAGHLAKNQQLATSGPYAYVRNPLYAGTLLVAAGLAIAARRWELALLFAAVFVFIYLPVIEQEEQHLSKLFPQFAAYANRVPLLVPHGRKTSGTANFSSRLYVRNQEYQALIGYLAGLLLLAWKATA